MFAVETRARTLADALQGADVFFGLSSGNCVTPDMLRGMAPDPIVFALANPDPEIAYDVARATRPDAIVATGRSDYPNQVNNVLGFPFIFRGALDVRATVINDEMKLAATRALAALAKQDVPDSVRRAYGLEQMEFGREYLIPKPFDSRVLVWEASAVAEAAIRTGVAQQALDMNEYREQLERRLGKAREVMRVMIHKAQRAPKRIVFPEGEEDKILRASQILVEEKIATPILLGREAGDSRADGEPSSGERLDRDIDPASSPERARYTAESLSVAPAERHDAARGGRDGAAAHHICGSDGAVGRGGRAGRGPDPALSRHHTAGAPGDRRAPRAAQSFGCLHADHAARRHLLPGRRDGQHRAILGRPGGDRHLRGRDGAPFRAGAAGGPAFVFQFRQHAASAGGESGAGRGVASRTRSRA